MTMFRFYCFCLCVALSFPVFAQENTLSDSREHETSLLWDQAISARDQGNLSEAERLLRRSHEISHDGRVAFELGQVLAEQGNNEEAIHWLERCSRSSDLSLQEQRRARNHARHLRHTRGVLVIEGSEGISNLSIDGSPSDQRRITLSVGLHNVQYTDENGQEITEQREILPDQEVLLNIDSTSPYAFDSSEQSGIPRWALWTSLGLTIGFLAGMVATFTLNVRQEREVMGNPTDGDSATLEVSQPLRVVSWVLGGLTGLGFGLTLVFIPFLRPKSGSEDEDSASTRLLFRTARIGLNFNSG